MATTRATRLAITSPTKELGMDELKYITIARKIAALNPYGDWEARAQQLLNLFKEAYEEGYDAGYGDCSADIGLHVQ